MIIKIGDEYLDFNEDVEMERQVFSVESNENVGDFSYSFTVQPTDHNKKALGITTIDAINKPIFHNSDNAELQTNEGITIHRGSVIVTNTFGIDCSFISGNSNFIKSITGKVIDLDFSDRDVLLSESAIVDSWTETEGLVFPVVDRGSLDFRKDAFLILRVFKGRLDLNDFQPFMYIKTIIDKIMVKSGLKIDGELINDPTYNSLVTTNNSNDYTNNKLKNNAVYVGKSIPQTITDAGFTKITFDNDDDVQFYNSIESEFDFINSRWTVSFDSLINITAGLYTSDDSKKINFEWRRNGGNITNVYTKGSYIEINMPSDPSDVTHSHATPGDYYELWATVDSSTPGSVDINSGTFKGDITSTAMIFAQAVLPDQDCVDFLKDIFKILNVVCEFDQYTKTIKTKLFKNIINSEAQDLSIYVSELDSETGFEIVSNYAQSNTLAYGQDNLPEIEKYNKENLTDYGDGVISIDNKFLEQEKELYKVNFTAPFSKFYPFFGLQLLKLNALSFGELTEDNTIAVTSVTDSGGSAEFQMPTGSPSTNIFYNNLFIDDATGIRGYKPRSEVSSSNQYLAVNIPNVTLPVDIRFSYDDGSSAGPLIGTEGFPQTLLNFTVPAYDGEWQDVNFIAMPRSNAAVAVFAPYKDGIFNIIQGLSFGSIPQKDTLTLIDTYYRQTKDVLNDPVKVIASMNLPESVYYSIDLLRPIRITTEKFNTLFFCQKITGYKNSWTPCLVELVKLG